MDSFARSLINLRFWAGAFLVLLVLVWSPTPVSSAVIGSFDLNGIELDLESGTLDGGSVSISGNTKTKVFPSMNFTATEDDEEISMTVNLNFKKTGDELDTGTYSIIGPFDNPRKNAHAVATVTFTETEGAFNYTSESNDDLSARGSITIDSIGSESATGTMNLVFRNYRGFRRSNRKLIIEEFDFSVDSSTTEEESTEESTE